MTYEYQIMSSQINSILESSAANTTIKAPDEHYLLDYKPLSVKLSNGKSLVLEKRHLIEFIIKSNNQIKRR